MNKKKDRFFCYLHVTPYVFQYLLINFGLKDSRFPYAVNFAKDKILDKLVKRMLVKPSHRFDKRILPAPGKNRSHRVAIEIDEVTFYSSGWEISPTDAVDLALFLERRCHAILLTFLNMRIVFNNSLLECIDAFYKRYHFNEDTWPSESIRRIWYRDKSFDRAEFRNYICKQIEMNCLVQMKHTGLICTQGFEIYEKD